MQRIIKNNEVVDETWHLLLKDFNIDEITNCDDYIVPLQLWREHSRMLLARDGGLGIWLDADEEAEEIGEDVAQFQVIALNFPAFTDFLGFFIGVKPDAQAAVAGQEHTAVFAPQLQRHDVVVAVGDLVDVEVLGQQVPGFVDDFVVLNDSLHRRVP